MLVAVVAYSFRHYPNRSGATASISPVPQRVTLGDSASAAELRRRIQSPGQYDVSTQGEDTTVRMTTYSGLTGPELEQAFRHVEVERSCISADIERLAGKDTLTPENILDIAKLRRDVEMLRVSHELIRTGEFFAADSQTCSNIKNFLRRSDRERSRHCFFSERAVVRNGKQVMLLLVIDWWADAELRKAHEATLQITYDRHQQFADEFNRKSPEARHTAYLRSEELKAAMKVAPAGERYALFLELQKITPLGTRFDRTTCLLKVIE